LGVPLPITRLLRTSFIGSVRLSALFPVKTGRCRLHPSRSSSFRRAGSQKISRFFRYVEKKRIFTSHYTKIGF
jgi:hypothetical protein